MSYLLPDEITFDVTQEHIDKGVPWDGTACPCWHALFDQKWAIESVDHDMIFIDNKFGETCGYRLSSEATKWIEDFDDGQPCIPATFTIHLEDPDWRLYYVYHP